ncbi:hypothetical protein [Vulcaniibacterium tengchongense]|uniref:Uncharacterized protein n=1 Tax=Vulcaniibacterium tengchongense TaxID=1273429 RepID=A0A3N4VFQ9_9GAMM|nr:hypothetical protein [Vulcaniibacterium tengchongense]RPE81852.1 hypothetical protein EDC50_1054 [Vulcaniibacterium tengchongense]
MTPTTLPNQPPLAGDFDLGDGQYCRVTITRAGGANGHVTYHAQAWQIDATGTFVLDVSGFPIRTPGTDHSVNLSGLATRTRCRDPGWIKHVQQPGVVLDPQDPPDGWATGHGAPTGAGSVGDRYLDLDTGQGWEWSEGELARIRKGKAEELAQILAERALEAQLAGL